MTIGTTHLAGRHPQEVRYYDANVARSVYAANLDERVPPPYGAWYLESMDSHGAWIASASDLVRFARAFDDAEKCPLLAADSVRTMFERPPGLAGADKDGKPLEKYYCAGWQIVADDQGETRFEQHGGSLPGTSTKLVRRKDGRNFAILFNARETAFTDRLAEPISEELNRALNSITDWPDVDYFEEHSGT
jgi:N-acyl-D-amino-acid deacylase